jgi:hypothetical protein
MKPAHNCKTFQLYLLHSRLWKVYFWKTWEIKTEMSYVNALNKNVVCWLPLEHKGRLKPKIIFEVVSYSFIQTTDVASSANATRNRDFAA